MPIIAIPDAEYTEIVRRVHDLDHKKSITLLSSSKEPIRFYRTDAGIRAIRVVENKKVRFQVEPLGKVMKEMPAVSPEQEREQLRTILRRDNPTYNEARIQLEIDLIYEKRQSVQTIMKEMGCNARDALRALEQGIAQVEAQKMCEEKSNPKASEPSDWK